MAAAWNIVDYQSLHSAQARSGCRGRPRTKDLESFLESDGEMKVRSFPRRAFKSDFTAHLIDQLSRDDQPKSCAAEAPACRYFRLYKRLKQASLSFGGDPNAGVGDFEAYQQIVVRFFHSA